MRAAGSAGSSPKPGPLRAATSDVPAVVATATPARLSTTERIWAGIISVLGAALVLGTLVWFAVSTGGELVSKETLTSTTGDGASATETTEYSDAIVVFALTAGTGLLLAGAFYGRLRELKLGALTLGLGELPPEKQQTIAEKVTEQIAGTTDDPRQQARLAAEAMARAQEMFREAYWGVVPSPPDEALEELAREATSDVLSRAGVAPPAPRRD
jgi:hypothetical protein